MHIKHKQYGDEQGNDILAISVKLPVHVSRAEILISKTSAEADIFTLKIIVGG